MDDQSGIAGNTKPMTPTGTGKRPGCHVDGRSAKRRAPLNNTASKMAGQRRNRGQDDDDAEEQPEDLTPMMVAAR